MDFLLEQNALMPVAFLLGYIAAAVCPFIAYIFKTIVGKLRKRKAALKRDKAKNALKEAEAALLSFWNR